MVKSSICNVQKEKKVPNKQILFTYKATQDLFHLMLLFCIFQCCYPHPWNIFFHTTAIQRTYQSKAIIILTWHLLIICTMGLAEQMAQSTWFAILIFSMNFIKKVIFFNFLYLSYSKKVMAFLWHSVKPVWMK
jgi:hypothetical protein